MNINNTKILICGVLPPPKFGHSVMYDMLMKSSFADAFNISFLNMHFWSYQTNKKVTILKVFKMFFYLCDYICRLCWFRPKYVLYNISFYPTPFIKDFLFCYIGALFGAKVVLHDHGQYLKELYDNSNNTKRSLIRVLMKKIKASIVMGPNTISIYDGFFKRDGIFVGEGAVCDLSCYKNNDEKCNDIKTILYFSHMSRDKGVFIAYEAAHKILLSDQSVRFIFAGPLIEEQAIKSYHQLEQSFSGRVEHIGYIDEDSEKSKLFQRADIYIFPTIRDVFGLAMVEAMSMSMPIIASHEGNIPAILPDVSHEMLFKKGDANELAMRIQILLGNANKCAILGQANRAQFDKKYTVEQYGKRMIDIFKQIDQLVAT